jgi:hypothetical protein
MMKLDPTLKHLGTVLRRRLTDVSAADTPSRIAELLERLTRVGQSGRPNDAPNLASGPK